MNTGMLELAVKLSCMLLGLLPGVYVPQGKFTVGGCKQHTWRLQLLSSEPRLTCVQSEHAGGCRTVVCAHGGNNKFVACGPCTNGYNVYCVQLSATILLHSDARWSCATKPLKP